MIYDIKSRSDLLTGASLIINIPECEVDKKALNTIQADKPRFILPFRHRWVDGQIEFTYHIGSNCKLQYLSGNRALKDYTRLWLGMLDPLLDCGDWFMKPYSFVLSSAYLYCDKSSNAVSYVYIPSIRDCSDYDSLVTMATDVSKYITVTDVALENKALRAIMKDFNPSEFIGMLKLHSIERVPLENTHYAPVQQPLPAKPEVTGTAGNALELPSYGPSENGEDRQSANRQGIAGDIMINLPVNGGAAKAGETKDESDANKQKGFGAFFGKYSGSRQDSARTSGKREAQQEPQAGAEQASPGAHEPVFLPESSFAFPEAGGAFPYLDMAPPEEADDDTQDLAEQAGATRMRLVGSLLLPPMIDIAIEMGGIFAIGRFDAATGEQQSDFEFDKKTKAVSRRHAVIERGTEEYSIIDLSSSAGTFINGARLPPNTPYALENGCRISFGNAGADYIWEMI